MPRARQHFYVFFTAISCLFLACKPLLANTADSAPQRFKEAAVVSTHYLASEVGRNIMAQGGNAIDAAVATAFALAVVYPEAGNLGGGGFLVLRQNDGFAAAIDFRETAPSAAHADLYVREDGQVDQQASRMGSLSVAVPGTVAGLFYALEHYGSLSRQEVLSPAIELAENGFVLDEGFRSRQFSRYPETARIFLHPNGRPYAAGERFFQKDLAWTLRRLAEDGPDVFYSGEIARLILSSMQKHGGLIRAEDLKSYEVKERPVVRGYYHGYEVLSMPPPSAGGICLIHLLQMLEYLDHARHPWHSPASLHLLAEAERRCYADRSYYLGDPDYVRIPKAVLLSKEYATKRASTISPVEATPSDEVSHGLLPAIAPESDETTHLSVVDPAGNCVALTTTLNGRFGSHLVVGGAGFLLNNEMDDFSAHPNSPNMYGLTGGRANSIAPGKRMLSSMTPSIVALDGKACLVIGSPGGSTIITTVLQCILNVLDHGMDMQTAVSAPRVHHQWQPDVLHIETAPYAISKEAILRLQEFGHEIQQRRPIGVANCIRIDPDSGSIEGGADPRSSTSAASGF